jgi:hypothetical protein
MAEANKETGSPVHPLTNGAAAAAILSAGAGFTVLALLAFAADASKKLKPLLNFYDPVGPVSGVTSLGIFIWLLCWLGLHMAWRDRHIPLAAVNIAAFVGIAIGFLLTFPPFADLLQGE